MLGAHRISRVRAVRPPVASFCDTRQSSPNLPGADAFRRCPTFLPAAQPFMLSLPRPGECRMRAWFALAAAALLWATAGRAHAAGIDLLVVLAADVSRSVDDSEFQLQRKGYAAALTDPRVLKAIRATKTGRSACALSNGRARTTNRSCCHGPRSATRRMAAAPRPCPQGRPGLYPTLRRSRR